ncbi:hypothetical protein SDC9_78157 [bioreactor metagenome]|uniref:NAD-specific glutamate dehydrogenase n=1 Tax=bioreactor metagenome TaxID=1076179 RepID=A0A644YUS5_9ZZZZ
MPADEDRACGELLDPEQGPAELPGPRAGEPDHPEDLAAADGQRDAPQVLAPQLLGPEELGVLRRGLVGPAARQLDLLAGDQAGQVRLGDVLEVVDRVHPPVAQHRDRVGQLEHLAQVVGDEDEGGAPRPQVADELEQLGPLAVGQRGGGLIEDDQLRAAVHGADDVQLAGVDRAELADRGAWVDLEAVRRELLGGVVVDPRPVDQAPAGRQDAGEDVLGDGEVGERVLVLGDQPDAELLAGEDVQRAQVAALEQDLTGGGRVDAGDDVHQGRLARAVAAEQGVDLAGVDDEVRVRQCAGGPEHLRDSADLQQYVSHGSLLPPGAGRHGDGRHPIGSLARVAPDQGVVRRGGVDHHGVEHDGRAGLALGEGDLLVEVLALGGEGARGRHSLSLHRVRVQDLGGDAPDTEDVDGDLAVDVAVLDQLEDVTEAVVGNDHHVALGALLLPQVVRPERLDDAEGGGVGRRVDQVDRPAGGLLVGDHVVEGAGGLVGLRGTEHGDQLDVGVLLDHALEALGTVLEHLGDDLAVEVDDDTLGLAVLLGQHLDGLLTCQLARLLGVEEDRDVHLGVVGLVVDHGDRDLGILGPGQHVGDRVTVVRVDDDGGRLDVLDEVVELVVLLGRVRLGDDDLAGVAEQLGGVGDALRHRDVHLLGGVLRGVPDLTLGPAGRAAGGG